MVDRSVLQDHDLAPGALREQLTVEGLPELDSLPPGTRIAAGAGILEVIDSCAPCLVIGEYNGVEDREAFRQSLEGRRGMFVEFVEPAEISVGDVVRVL
jgi:MOSC domain-containing protein YiiM